MGTKIDPFGDLKLIRVIKPVNRNLVFEFEEEGRTYLFRQDMVYLEMVSHIMTGHG